MTPHDGAHGPSTPVVDGPRTEDLLCESTVADALEGTQSRTSHQHEWLVTTFDTRRSQPEQGWKLHVSAHPATALEVLTRVLPVVRRHKVRFKVASSPRALSLLNAGAGGPSQIGKFITVYPEDDDQAVALASELDLATEGLHGPRIPSDRPFRNGSLVHYRFGAFTGSALMLLPDGTVVSALRAPGGGLEPDERRAVYSAPSWAVNPFLQDDPAPSAVAVEELLQGSAYRVLGLLSNSGRGAVFIGVDLAQRRRCVLKAAQRGSGADPGPSELALRREADILRSLPAHPAWPGYFDLVEAEDQLLLVVEDIDGVSIGEHVADLLMRGKPIETSEAADLGLRVAEAVVALHQQGVAHRDLKSENLLVTPDGAVRMVDFEHAARFGEQATPGGTRGYMSPQQREGSAADSQDDVYAIGALLLLLATGCEPSDAPDSHNLLSRPLELLRPGMSTELGDLIRACLDPSPEKRPRDVADVSTALREIRAGAEAPGGRPSAARARVLGPAHDLPLAGALPFVGTLRPTAEELTDTATRLCDALCDRATDAPDGSLMWISTAPGTLPVPYRQINNGVPGVLLGLASGLEVSGAERHRDVLTRGARWLAESSEVPGAKVSGLYAGESGVGASLLLSGLISGDRRMIDAAHECEERLRDYPFDAVDLYHGTAGRLRFLAMLWWFDPDRDILAHALRCAGHLHDTAVTRDGLSWWTGDENADGVAVASYAHGTAGVADALLDLYEMTGESDHLDLAGNAARWVEGQSITGLPKGGLDWGNGGTFGGLWCYGASGVGLLFLHLLRLGAYTDAGDIATRAGHSVALGGRYAGPGLCHGLSGSIEYLLDVHQHTGDTAWLDASWELQRLLASFRRTGGGGVGFPRTAEGESDISYMLGDSGIVGTLLRQATDGRVPRLLSTEAVRTRTASRPNTAPAISPRP